MAIETDRGCSDADAASATEALPETTLVLAARRHPPHWAEQRIAAWDEAGFRAAAPFVIDKYWSSQQSINVFEVVGTAHPEYQGLTWAAFLARGKRMRQNLLLQDQHPAYYLSEAVKLPTMSYIALNNSGWHVYKDGHHRTCIARFMFDGLGRAMLHGVWVEAYRTDEIAAEAYRRLQDIIARRRLPILVEPERVTLSREDTPGWMCERYQVWLKIKDCAAGTDAVLSPREALDAAQRLAGQSGGLWKWLRAMLTWR